MDKINANHRYIKTTSWRSLDRVRVRLGRPVHCPTLLANGRRRPQPYKTRYVEVTETEVKKVGNIPGAMLTKFTDKDFYRDGICTVFR